MNCSILTINGTPLTALPSQRKEIELYIDKSWHLDQYFLPGAPTIITITVLNVKAWGFNAVKNLLPAVSNVRVFYFK